MEKKDSVSVQDIIKLLHMIGNKLENKKDFHCKIYDSAKAIIMLKNIPRIYATLDDFKDNNYFVRVYHDSDQKSRIFSREYIQGKSSNMLHSTALKKIKYKVINNMVTLGNTISLLENQTLSKKAAAIINLFFSKNHFYEMLTGVFLTSFGHNPLFKIIYIDLEASTSTKVYIGIKAKQDNIFWEIEKSFQKIREEIVELFSIKKWKYEDLEAKYADYINQFFLLLSQHIDIMTIMHINFATMIRYLDCNEIAIYLQHMRSYITSEFIDSKTNTALLTSIDKYEKNKNEYKLLLSHWGLIGMWSSHQDPDFFCDMTLECSNADKTNYFMLVADRMIEDQVNMRYYLYRHFYKIKMQSLELNSQLNILDTITINHIINYPIVLLEKYYIR